jgi:hypothetical protein
MKYHVQDEHPKTVPCRACQAPMVWLKTSPATALTMGKSMPLSWKTRERAEGGGWMLETHWSDCPDRAKFKKPKKEEPDDPQR